MKKAGGRPIRRISSSSEYRIKRWNEHHIKKTRTEQTKQEGRSEAENWEENRRNHPRHLGLHYHHRRHENPPCVHREASCGCGEEVDSVYRHHSYHRKSRRSHNEDQRHEFYCE